MLAQVENSLLVIIDIQQRLVSAMPPEDAERTIRQSNLLLQAADTLAVPVIVTEQYPKGLGSTVEAVISCCPDNTQNIEKVCFSCAQSDTFMVQIRESHKRQIILAGMEAHICILQTAMALHEQGFQVFVAEDAVCSRQQTNAVNAMQRLRADGITVTNAESVMFEWLGSASHPQFKRLSRVLV